MQRKSVVRQRPTEDLKAQVLRLSRENTALRREVAKLQVFRSMAYRDPLTGLWNRRYFEERLAEEQSRSQRAGSGRRFSLLVVDINDFKNINDQHGHPVGDALLKWAGEFLHTHLRTHDVACRTGGDEFSVLLPDVSSEDASRLVARLREQLVVANRGREIPLGMSLGAATWPDVGATTGRPHRPRRRSDVRRQGRQKSAAAAMSKPAAEAPKPRVAHDGRARVPRRRAPKPWQRTARRRPPFPRDGRPSRSPRARERRWASRPLVRGDVDGATPARQGPARDDRAALPSDGASAARRVPLREVEGLTVIGEDVTLEVAAAGRSPSSSAPPPRSGPERIKHPPSRLAKLGVQARLAPRAGRFVRLRPDVRGRVRDRGRRRRDAATTRAPSTFSSTRRRRPALDRVAALSKRLDPAGALGSSAPRGKDTSVTEERPAAPGSPPASSTSRWPRSPRPIRRWEFVIPLAKRPRLTVTRGRRGSCSGRGSAPASPERSRHRDHRHQHPGGQGSPRHPVEVLAPGPVAPEVSPTRAIPRT